MVAKIDLKEGVLREADLTLKISHLGCSSLKNTHSLKNNSCFENEDFLRLGFLKISFIYENPSP